MRDKATGAERSLIRARMRDLSAPVALSRKITGDDRHRWSYVYEWTSDQGVEWALKPPLQSLCGWRRNAQTCRQLVERPAFVGFHCAGGSSVEQDSPAEPKMVARAALLVENGPGPAKSRRAAKSRHLTSATQVAGAKNLPNEPPPPRRTNHPRRVVRTTPAASCGEGWFARRAVRPTYPRLATYID